MISTPDLIGHLGYIIILIGTRLLHKKVETGWLFRVTGDLIWSAVGLYLGLTSVWIWSTVFAINDFYGYLKWKKEQSLQSP